MDAVERSPIKPGSAPLGGALGLAVASEVPNHRADVNAGVVCVETD